MLERRRYPRVELTTVAEVELDREERVEVAIQNISSSGLQFECDQTAESSITPNGQWEPVSLTIRFTFPGGEAASFEAGCSVTSSRRISRDRFVIGMRFTEFSENSFENLAAFISARLK